MPASPLPDGSIVLLVDDDELVRGTMRRVLGRAGYPVREAESVQAALVAWREDAGRIALLITDVVLASDHGHELAITLRRERPELPVVIVSGYGGSSLRQSATYPDDVHFLAKPFTMDGLLTVVRRALSGAPPVPSD